MDEAQRIHEYSDRLARTILAEVVQGTYKGTRTRFFLSNFTISVRHKSGKIRIGQCHPK